MNAITVSHQLDLVVASPLTEATKKRDALLADAVQVETVDDRFSSTSASETLKALKDFSAQIEKQRKAVKDPIIDLGKRIDAVAKDLTEGIGAEVDRIGRLIGNFEAKEREAAAEAQRKVEAEARAIKQRAEEQAKAKELAATTEEEANRQADEVRAEAAAKVAELQQATPAATKLSNGLRLRQDVELDIHDAAALYASEPQLVTLVPKVAELKAYIRANPNIQLPGVKFAWVNKV